MRSTRRSALAAVVAASALVLTACSGNDGAAGGAEAEDNAGIVQATAVTVAWNQPFYSYNQDSITGNAKANANITYLMKSGFNYYDEDLNLVRDESFGSYEKVSDDPLTIEYSFADTAT